MTRVRIPPKPRTRAKPVKGAGNKNPTPAPVIHRFQKGNTGRKVGSKNKMGVRLKEAILEAAERSGKDGRGKDGAVGYLVWLSRTEPAVFGRMLEKIMPLQVDVKDKTERTFTASEAVERLRSRGLPVPPTLVDLAHDLGTAVAMRQEQDDDDALDAEQDGDDQDGDDEQEDAA